MSLANTILYAHVDEVRRAISHQELNVIDEYGYTPLIEAAIIDSVEKAEILIQAGADTNFADLTGRSPLHWATDNNNAELTELLLENKADPNCYSSAGQPAMVMPLLRGQTKIKNLLMEHGASLQFTQDFINAKLLAHRFLLRGRVDIVNTKNELIEIDYEGFYIESSIAFLLNSLKDYKNNFHARRIRPYFEEFKRVITALQAAAELIKFQHYKINVERHEKIISQLLAQDLLVIPVTYEGHAITFVKYGSLLVRCDRGEYGMKNGTVIIYRIGNHQALTKQFLINLLYQPLSKRFVTKEIQKILSLDTMMTLPLAPQESGNCSWANVEASMLAAMFLLLVEKAPSMSPQHTQECQDKAFFVYDTWMQWDRDRSLDFCIDSFSDVDDLHKITKAAILTSIFVQQCRYEDLNDLDRVKRILPIISQRKYSYILKTYLDVFKETRNQTLITRIENYLDDFGVDL